MTDLTKKVDSALARFDRVTQQLDSRSGLVRDARKRELRRLNEGLVKTLVRIGVAVGIVSLATIVIGDAKQLQALLEPSIKVELMGEIKPLPAKAETKPAMTIPIKKPE